MDNTTVVVGVDGSPNSYAAIDHAIRYLERHGGGTLRAVMAWAYGPVAATSVGLGMGGTLPPADLMAEATSEALDTYLESLEIPADITIDKVVEEGAPSAVLIDAAGDDADLIVVGKRGHGGFVGLLMGSVASQVVNHASCPVLVVPAGHST